MSEFNVGDDVYVITYGSVANKATVTRVTKTLAILDEGRHRFNRTTGRRVGVGSWDSWQIVHPTPERDARWRAQQVRIAAALLSVAAREGEPSAIRKAYEKWDRLVTEGTRPDRGVTRRERW